MNDALKDHAPNRINSIETLVDLYDKPIWLVAQEHLGSNLFGDTHMMPWLVGGFATFDFPKGRESFLLHTQDRHKSLGRAIRLSAFHVSDFENWNASGSNAIFRSKEDAEQYRVALALLYAHNPVKMWRPREATFGYSKFSTAFFSQRGEIFPMSAISTRN